jgi:hypothetical protein
MTDDIHFPNQSFEILPDVQHGYHLTSTIILLQVALYQVVKGLGVIRVREYTQNGGTRMLCQKIKMDPDFEKVDKLLIVDHR